MAAANRKAPATSATRARDQRNVIFRKEFTRSPRDRARITNAYAACDFEIEVTILALSAVVFSSTRHTAKSHQHVDKVAAGGD
jgi:hypothetical protein